MNEKARPSFLERELERFAKRSDELAWSIKPLPQPNEFGRVTLPYRELASLLSAHRKLAYGNGFFYGVSCAMGRSSGGDSEKKGPSR